MSDRYVVTMTGPSLSYFDGPAVDDMDALAECIRVNWPDPGAYHACVTGGGKESSGAVTVYANRTFSLGARWNLPTPVEPIDVSDLGVAVGVPDVG